MKPILTVVFVVGLFVLISSCAKEESSNEHTLGDYDAMPEQLEQSSESENEYDIEQTMKCNGYASLCNKRFNEVAYPTTHNSMSNKDEGWSPPNQYHDIPRQLKDGIRGLMLDVLYDDEENDGIAYLCHGWCALGKKKLSDGLAEIRAFMDENPNEVITIIFECYVEPEDILIGFEDSGLIEYLHTQPANEPWPTLKEMVDAGERLVVFTDKDGGAYPWYHDVWQYCWETDYDNKTIDDLSCDPNRGTKGNPLFILNHFLTNPFAKPELAEQINYNPFFLDRALQCEREAGQIPNFVTVDFYSIGDLFEVCKKLNGVE